MKREERIREIERFILKKGLATVAEIAGYLNTSQSTVRRDLSLMHEKGLIIQNYGNILSCNFKGQGFEFLTQRQRQNIDTKMKLGEGAAKLISDNDSVFLESGTTLLEVARNIEAKNVTVVTVDLSIANVLAPKANVTTMLLGGYIWQGTYLLVGEMAERNLKNMRFSLYFTSPGAIGKKGELMYYNIQTAPLRKMAMELSSAFVVVADSTKFEQKGGFIRGGSLSEADILVSDAVPEPFYDLIGKNGRIIEI